MRACVVAYTLTYETDALKEAVGGSACVSAYLRTSARQALKGAVW
jgi:hypothetical protein